MRYVELGGDNLRSHFVFRPRHAPEWLRAWFLPVVLLTNEEELTGKTFTTSLTTTNPNTYVKFIFLRTSPLRAAQSGSEILRSSKRGLTVHNGSRCIKHCGEQHCLLCRLKRYITQRMLRRYLTPTVFGQAGLPWRSQRRVFWPTGSNWQAKSFGEHETTVRKWKTNKQATKQQNHIHTCAHKQTNKHAHVQAHWHAHLNHESV